MNSYFIFAIVLTVAYIIYYAVIIAHDIYGKKGTDKPNEEVFDLGAPEEEESVAVTESETGFSIGSENYEMCIRDRPYVKLLKDVLGGLGLDPSQMMGLDPAVIDVYKRQRISST